MARFKYTMIMRQTSNKKGDKIGSRIGGWSESVYGPDESDPNITAFNLLCAARAALLTTAGAVIGQRYQQVLPKGRSSVAGRTFPGTIDAFSDMPQAALLCNATAPEGNVRRFTIRGLPDARTEEGEFLPTLGFVQAISDYFDQLQLWQFKARNLQSNTADINVILPDGSFDLNDDLAGLAPKVLVDVLRSKTDEGNLVGGTAFKVKSSTATDEGVLLNWKHGATEGGRMRLTQTVYRTMPRDTLVVVRTVVKKVGRPFGGYSGRASARH